MSYQACPYFNGMCAQQCPICPPTDSCQFLVTDIDAPEESPLTDEELEDMKNQTLCAQCLAKDLICVAGSYTKNGQCKFFTPTPPTK